MMADRSTTKVLVICVLVVFTVARPATSAPANPAVQPCCTVDSSFLDDVWAKVGEQTCLKCHRPGGDAADSEFVLRPTLRDRNVLSQNLAAFFRMARKQDDGQSRLLLKVAGKLDHGGGEVLKPGSTGYRILERFVSRVSTPKSRVQPAETVPANGTSFFEGVEFATPQRLLRRVTLSLAGRLPTVEEQKMVAQHGDSAIGGILDGIMNEDAFFIRLKEGFNDIYLTLGYDGNGEEVLSYDHFQPTRLWYQKHDLTKFPEKERQRARWSLADVYRDAIRREPLELIDYIVRNNRPFTELATADYIMVSPYSARGYGVFDEMRQTFKDEDDPFEYHPVKLKALKSRNGKVQKSETGLYPHAGFLSMFHYLRRYPTTETNRNRLRARMYYQHFLGVDVMALAPRVMDAAAVSAKFKVPTMQAADCVVCHKAIDPVAGLFQDFNEGGHLGPRKDGWYSDMFGPGLEGEDLPDSDRWRALQWLGERTAKDPRFAVAMTEHVYYILMGRQVLQAPADIDDSLFGARRRAFQEQRKLIEEVAERFAASKFNLKTAFKELVQSKFYRVDGLATAADDPTRAAELDDVGLVRLLTPEQLERKIEAVFGRKWGRLVHRESKFEILYGGIDSRSVTERMTEPSGAMGAIQRIMANDVACQNVSLDFTKPKAERRLFPHIERTVYPDGTAAAESQIRTAIVHLHQHILGQTHPPDDPAVNLTYELFAGAVSDAEKNRVDKTGSYFCERVDNKRLDDSHYTLRAWRGVVTFLLRQHDFLYE
ncbi:MAG: hypothetical protein O3A00_13235 [Planctomycetota bacterium]|nr:hypothetical protein [Planctomycetota bacterium]